MADILQLPDCGTGSNKFNSGLPLCDIIRDIPFGIIGLDPGVGFNASDRASVSAFITKLRTLTRNPRGSRAYPFFKLTNFDDKSKEPTKAALGNLTNGEITTNDGIPAFGFQHRIGELYHKKLIEAQAAGLTWIILDRKYVGYGTVSNNIFYGYSLSEFYVALAKFGNLSQGSIYAFDMTLADITEYKENGAFVQLDKSVAGVTGIRDVVLSNFNMTGSVLKVGYTAFGGKNLTDLFATELAQTGAHVVKDSTGAAVTVSAAYDSVNKVMSLTLSGTPWTSAASGATFTYDLASASALAALASPIDGYESAGVLTFTKP